MKLVASRGDRIVAVDMHPRGNSLGPVPFSGSLSGSLEPRILINGQPAARVGSTATGGHGVRNCGHAGAGEVIAGSSRVFFNGHPAARNGDAARTCTCAGNPTSPLVMVASGQVWAS